MTLYSNDTILLINHVASVFPDQSFQALVDPFDRKITRESERYRYSCRTQWSGSAAE